MIQAISRRLDRLQERFTDGCDNCNVTVTFTDGNKITVPYYPDFTGYYDNDGTMHESEIERRGWCGEVAALECDNWRIDGMISLAAALWRAKHGEC